MKKNILFFLLLPAFAFGESFKISGERYDFSEKNGLSLYGCEKGCEALKVIESTKKIDLTKLRKGKKYVNSTGSDSCALAYKARATIGVNSGGDQRAFCIFKDQSMVEMNSLSSYLETKNITK